MEEASAREALTELEHVVLGVVWRRGPCSAYLVRREFAVSASFHWSSSAGSIYPVVRRLERLGLVQARVQSWGKAGKREIEVTPKGVEALKQWLGDVPPDLAGPSPDFIRTRSNFLGVLAPEERIDFLLRAEAATKAQLPIVEDAVEVSRTRPSEIEYWASLGGVYELRARLAWLRAVRKGLQERR